jgi:predicted flap endonuclease-1-like 5' DNA nuclease
MGAWLLFVLVVGPDAVRMVTDRRIPPGRPGPDTLLVKRTYSTPVSARSPSSPRAVPGDFRANPLQFLSFAPADSLELLPGIGPVLAARIADARTGKSPYTTWNDLLAVKGIGPKTVERLRSLVNP